GVTVPGGRTVDVGAGPHRVDPALDFGVVRAAEALPEAGGDQTAPRAGCTLADEPDVQADHRAAAFADHLGADLIGDTGGHEQFHVHVPPGDGAQDRDLRVDDPFWRSGI